MRWIPIAVSVCSLVVAVLSLLHSRRLARRVGAGAVAAESVRRIMVVADEAGHLEMQATLRQIDGTTALAWMEFERKVRQLGAMLPIEARQSASCFSLPWHELLQAQKTADAGTLKESVDIARLMLQFVGAFFMRCVIAREKGESVTQPSLPTLAAIREGLSPPDA
jgi:hypothetical protein